MTNNNQNMTSKQVERQQSAPYWIELCSIAMLFISVAVIVIYTMNTRREIAAIDKEIADTVSEIELNKCLIANLEKTHEALKNDKVVAFAQKHKMIHPMPGQICVMMLDKPSEQRDYMLARQKREHSPLSTIATIFKTMEK